MPDFKLQVETSRPNGKPGYMDHHTAAWFRPGITEEEAARALRTALLLTLASAKAVSRTLAPDRASHFMQYVLVISPDEIGRQAETINRQMEMEGH